MALDIIDSKWLNKGIPGLGPDMGTDLSPGAIEGLKGQSAGRGMQALRAALQPFSLAQTTGDSPWLGSGDPQHAGVGTDAAKAKDTTDDPTGLRQQLEQIPEEQREQIAGALKKLLSGLENEEGFDKLKDKTGEDWLSMLVELLKENPGLADKMKDRAQANAPAMANRGGGMPNFGGGAMPNLGGAQSSGSPQAQQARYSAPHQNPSSPGNKRTSSEAPNEQQAGTPDIPNAENVSAIAGKNGVPAGLQPNAARGAALVRKMGFKGTIGGVGHRTGKSDHPHGNAIDVMTNKDMKKGQEITNFFVKNANKLGVKYVIFNQRMYSAKTGWKGRAMTDRGSATANHLDHPHISFYGGKLR